MNGSIILDKDIPSGSLIKNLLANVRDISSPPGLEDFWRRDRLPIPVSWASLVAQLVKNPPAMWETWV